MAGHETQKLFIALVAGALFAVALAFFTVGIRQALRSGEPGRSTYSSGAFAGGIITAVVSAMNTWVMITLLDTVIQPPGRSDPARLIGALGVNAWLPFMVGAAVLLLSTGLGGLRSQPYCRSGWRSSRSCSGCAPCSARRASRSGSRCRSGASSSASC